MPAAVYEVLAIVFRYWFALLGVVIVWRAALWVRKDGAWRKRTLRQLPDAGYIGEFIVLTEGGPSYRAGDDLPVPREGVLGSARSCDICIALPDILPRAAHFELQEDGLHLLPRRPDELYVDDMPVQQEAVLHHGATLQIGELSLQLRLFEGVVPEADFPETPRAPGTKRPAKRRRAQVVEEEAFEEDFLEEAPQEERVDRPKRLPKPIPKPAPKPSKPVPKPVPKNKQPTQRGR